MFSKSKRGPLFKKCSKPKVRPRPKPNYREPPPLNYPMYKEPKPHKYEERQDHERVSSQENTPRSSSSEVRQPLYRSRSETPKLNGEPSGSDSGYGGYSVSLNEDSLSLNAEDENGNAGAFSYSHREGDEHLRSSSSVRYSRLSEALGEEDEVILEEDEVFLERDEGVYSRSSSTTNPRYREVEEPNDHEANTQVTSRGENAFLINEPKKGRFVKQISGKPNPRNARHLLSAQPHFSKANHTMSLSKSDGDLTVETRPKDQDSSVSKPLTSWRSCSALDSNNKKVRNDSVVPTSEEEEEDDEVFPLHHSSSNSAMERRKSVSFELPVEREIATYPPETMENPRRYKNRGSSSSSFRKSWTKRLSKLSFTSKKSKSSSSGTPLSLTPTSSPLPFLKRKVFDFETLSLRSADSSHLSEYTGKFSSLKLNLERKKSSFSVEPTLTGFVHDNTEFPLRCSGNYENDSCSIASFVSIESSASKLDTSPKITKYPLRKKCVYKVSPTEDVKFKLPTKPKKKGPIKAFKSLIGGSSKSTLDLSSLEKASDSGISRSYDDILKENNFPTQEEYLIDPRMFTLSTDMMDLGDFDDDDDYYRNARYLSKKGRHDTDHGKVTRKDSDSNNICGNSVSDGSFVNEMEQSFDIIRDRTLRKVSSKESAEEQKETALTPKRKNSVHNMVTKFEELERRFSQASIKKQPLVSNKIKVMHFSKSESDQNMPLQESMKQPTLDCQNEEINQVDIRTSKSTAILPSHDTVMEMKSGDETSRGRVSRKKLNISHSVQPRERSSERRPPPPRPPKPVERKTKSRAPLDLSIDNKNNLERSKSVPVLNTDISKIIQNFEEIDDGQEIIKTECTDLVTDEKQNEECDVEIETSVREFQGCFQESKDKFHEGEVLGEGLSTPDIRVETTSPLSEIEADKSNISSYHLTVQKSSSVSSYEDFDKCSVGSTSSVDRLSPRARTPKARKIPPKRPPPPKIPLERLHSYAQKASKGDLTGLRVDAPLPDQPAPPKPPRLFHILSGHKKDFKNSDSLGSTKYRRFSVVDSEYDMIVAISPGVGELSSENESATSPATDIDMDENTYKRYPIDDSDEDLRMCGLKGKRYSSHLFQLSNSTADTECDAVEEERFSSADCSQGQEVDDWVSSTNSGHDQASVADRTAFFESHSVREGISIKQELDDGDSTREVCTRGRPETCWAKSTDDLIQPVDDTYPIKKENPVNALQDSGDAEEKVEERSLSNFPINKLNPTFSKCDSLKNTTWLVEGEARCIAIIPGPGSMSDNEENSPGKPRHKQSSDESQVGNRSEKDDVMRAGNESCLKKVNNDIECSEDDSSRYESANSDSDSISTYGEPSTVKENETEKPTPSLRMFQPLPVPRREVFGNAISRFAPNAVDLNSAVCGESSLVPVKRTVVPMQIPDEKTLVKTQESQEPSSVDTQETGKPSRPSLQGSHGDPREAGPSSGERPQESQDVPSVVPREIGPTSPPVSHVSQEAPSAAPREVGPSVRPRLQEPQEPQEPRETGPSPGPRSLVFAPNTPPRPASVTPRPSSVLSCPERPLLSLFFERLLETQQISSSVHSGSNSPEYECKSGDGIADSNKSTNEDSEQCSDMSQKDKAGMKISARPRLSRSNHELKTLSMITDEQFSVSEEQTCMENHSGGSTSPKNPEEDLGSMRPSISDEGKHFKPISPSPPPRSLVSVQVVLPPSSSPSPPPPPSVPPPVFTRTKKDEIFEIITSREEEKDIVIEGTGNIPIEHEEICKDEEAYSTKDETTKRNTVQDTWFEGQRFIKIRPVEIQKRTRRRKMHKVRNEAKSNDDDDSEGELQRPPRPKPRRRLLRADAVQGSSTSSATSTSSSTTSTSSTDDEEGHVKHVKDLNLPYSVKEDNEGCNTPLDSAEVTSYDSTTMVVEESLNSPSVGISVRRASDSLLSLSLDQPKLRKSSCDLTPERGYSEDTKEELKVT